MHVRRLSLKYIEASLRLWGENPILGAGLSQVLAEPEEQAWSRRRKGINKGERQGRGSVWESQRQRKVDLRDEGIEGSRANEVTGDTIRRLRLDRQNCRELGIGSSQELTRRNQKSREESGK